MSWVSLCWKAQQELIVLAWQDWQHSSHVLICRVSRNNDVRPFGASHSSARLYCLWEVLEVATPPRSQLCPPHWCWRWLQSCEGGTFICEKGWPLSWYYCHTFPPLGVKWWALMISAVNGPYNHNYAHAKAGFQPSVTLWTTRPLQVRRQCCWIDSTADRPNNANLSSVNPFIYFQLVVSSVKTPSTQDKYHVTFTVLYNFGISTF